jgi:hypothetical protein
MEVVAEGRGGGAFQNFYERRESGTGYAITSKRDFSTAVEMTMLGGHSGWVSRFG